MSTKDMNAQWVKALKPPAEGREDWFDEKCTGLGLRVSFTGSKTWFVRYRRARDTRKYRYTIGEYPVYGLADAREKATEIILRAKRGEDPAAEKEAEKGAPSFKSLAHDYLDRHAAKKRTADEQRRIIDKDLLPAWGTRLATDITRRDVIALVDKIADRPAPVMANRTLNLIGRIYNWGISRDLVDHNPAMRVNGPGEERERDRVLSDVEIREVWKAIDADDDPVSAAAKLLLITGQRRGEVLRMRWEDISSDRKTWKIPADHAKNKQPHMVPVSAMAIVVLDQLEAAGRTRKYPSPWVFPSRIGSGQRHLGNVQKHVDAIRERAEVDFWLHDLRRTVATRLADLGVSRFLIGKVLNHTSASEVGLPRVTRVYDRHQYDDEKRDALERWSDRLQSILRGEEAKVRQIRARQAKPRERSAGK